MFQYRYLIDFHMYFHGKNLSIVKARASQRISVFFLFVALGMFIYPSYTISEDEELLAVWELDLGGGYSVNHSLIYRGVNMILVAEYGDGSSGESKLVERASSKESERRFDMSADETAEYFTISKNGTIRFYNWTGVSFGTAFSDFLHQDVLSIGVNIVETECQPKNLSPQASEVVRMYHQLHEFKDDPEFLQIGFGIGGPYNSWLVNIKRIPGSLDLIKELNFVPGDILMLGFSYLRRDSAAIELTESQIQASLKLIFCS